MVSNSSCKVHHSLSFLTGSARRAQTAQLFVMSGDFKLPAAVGKSLFNEDCYNSISSEGAQRVNPVKSILGLWYLLSRRTGGEE
jgi:hypothetical protein